LYSADTVVITVPTADLEEKADFATKVKQIRVQNVADTSDNYISYQVVSINAEGKSYVTVKTGDVNATDAKTIKVKLNGPISYVSKADFKVIGAIDNAQPSEVNINSSDNTVVELVFAKDSLPVDPANVKVQIGGDLPANPTEQQIAVAQAAVSSNDSYGRKLQVGLFDVADKIKPSVPTTLTASGNTITIPFEENVKAFNSASAFNVLVGGQEAKVTAVAANGTTKNVVLTIDKVANAGDLVVVSYDASNRYITDVNDNAVDGFSVTNNATATQAQQDAAAVAAAKSGLNVTFAGTETAAGVTSDVTLPTTVSGVTVDSITWSSDKPAVISNAGAVTRPVANETVVLTATIVKGDTTETKEFTLTVLAQ
jgi:uncharacterized repeat protein (TIGR02059 family)